MTYSSRSTTPDQDEQPLHRALEQSSIFGDLSQEMLSELAENMKVRAIRGGEQLLTQGEDSASMLIVVSGRLLAVRRNEDGTKTRLGEIGPGSSVGEVGLVLRQPRSADVLAIRDTSIAQLYREDYEALLKRHPIELNRAIARKIFEYSTIVPSKRPTAGASTYAVVPLDPTVDCNDFCRELTRALEKHGRTHHLTPVQGDTLHADEGATLESIGILNRIEQQFDTLVYEASFEPSAWSEFAIRQADKVIFVVAPDTSPADVDPNAPLFSGPGFEMVGKSLVVLHSSAATTPKVDVRWHDVFELRRLYPVRRRNEPDMQRLARFMTDNAIGLVLGGGGARGFAHIGVLKALEEADIPVDMICGNSMGALVAAQYANGTPLQRLIATTQKFAKGGERPTLPIHSIFGGNRIRRDLKALFGDATLESQWRQLFVVSCNLSHATVHVHDRGPLWEAVLASNSPAALVPPVIHKGDLLVDAALLDNVPVESMRQRLGFGTVIAVDVDVRDEVKVAPEVKQVNPWQLLWQRLFGKDDPHVPGIFDILNRSGHLGGLMRREASTKMADFYLQPPVSDFALMAYGKAETISDAGYRYARQAIAQWQQQNQSAGEKS